MKLRLALYIRPSSRSSTERMRGFKPERAALEFLTPPCCCGTCVSAPRSPFVMAFTRRWRTGFSRSEFLRQAFAAIQNFALGFCCAAATVFEAPQESAQPAF